MLLNCINWESSFNKEFPCKNKKHMEYFHNFVIFMGPKKALNYFPVKIFKLLSSAIFIVKNTLVIPFLKKKKLSVPFFFLGKYQKTTFYDGSLSENSKRLKMFHYFCKKLSHQCLVGSYIRIYSSFICQKLVFCNKSHQMLFCNKRWS